MGTSVLRPLWAASYHACQGKRRGKKRTKKELTAMLVHCQNLFTYHQGGVRNQTRPLLVECSNPSSLLTTDQLQP
ncbi:hypothetical protein OPV22_005489 [Ensete ventricosum]|uniref:Secreted protein n=1 Tax=Ensete ventricosum TaxID=4639 RepID=A0AAV8RGR0_ENSVE|nr:hypothetical protein OPV22_005489 [Ensete ventricosum]